MRHTLVIRLVSAIMLSLGVVAGRAADKPRAPEKGLAGFWYGPLKAGVIELRFGVVITDKPDGTLSGVLDSLDEGVKDIPMDEVSLKDKTVRFAIKPLTIVYEGTLSEDGGSIAGDFKQSGAVLPLTLQRTEKRVENNRPQHPKKPYPYVEEEVGYESHSGIKLAGTFTRPKGDGPFPAVLLITGSGAQDRDETILGHKPFLVLADHLTRKGVAVLRLDDRGVGGSTGVLMDATTDDLAGDVLAGVEYLKRRKDVRAGQIGLIGHSEGGMVAPLAASRSNDVAFIVLLAAPGLPGDEVLVQQLGLVLKAEKDVSEEDLAKAHERQRRLLAIVKEGRDAEAIQRSLLQLEKEELASLSDEQRKEYESLKGQAAAQVQKLWTPWFRSFVRYDPRPALASMKGPVLALNGEKDVQVAPKENLGAIERALREAGNRDVIVKELPGLNHLFQRSKTGALSEYGRIEETFAPQALEEISDWLLKRVAKR